MLDKFGNVCPVGVMGELCIIPFLWVPPSAVIHYFIDLVDIGGPAVAQGYLGQPDLTSKSFVALSIGDNSGVFFRTRDYGRYLSSGVSFLPLPIPLGPSFPFLDLRRYWSTMGD